MTLEQLKEKNAQSEEDKPITDGDINQEVIEPEVEADANKDGAVDNENEEGQETSENELTIEPWMQTEEEADSDGSGFKPDPKYQAKRLRAKIDEKDSELDELKAQIAELQKGQSTPVQTESKPLVRPTLEQCDYDEDEYNKRLDEYYEKKMVSTVSDHSQKAQQEAALKAQQEAKANAIKSSVDNHYQKAAKLVESGKVTQELYQQADLNVRQSLDELYRGQGDTLTDNLIATLDGIGADSEKVMFMLGRNPNKLNQFKNLLIKDSSGLQATAYLGLLNGEVNSAPMKNRRSQAPAPAAKVEGDSATNSEEAKLKRKWSKETDIQTRIRLKQEAKARGYDVKKW